MDSLQWWTVILVVVSVGMGQDTRLYLDQGAFLKEHGTAYINVDDRFVSLYKKVGLPEWGFRGVTRECSENPAFPDLECTDPWITGDKWYCSPNSFRFAERRAEKAVVRAREMVTLFEQLADLKPSSGGGKGRGKRGILGALGLGTGVLSMLFNAISSKLMSDHINEVAQEFQSFKREVEAESGRVSGVVNKNFKIVDRQLKELYSELNTATCREQLMYSRFLGNDISQHWDKVLDDIFFHVRNGYLGGKLSNRILPTGDLKILLRDHPELGNTAYSESLMNFYLTSSVIMVEAEVSPQAEYLYIHYVIVVPVIFPQFGFPLYEIATLPINHQDSCWRTVLPKYAYNNSGTLVGVGEDTCKISEMVSLCYETIPESRRNPCLML